MYPSKIYHLIIYLFVFGVIVSCSKNTSGPDFEEGLFSKEKPTGVQINKLTDFENTLHIGSNNGILRLKGDNLKLLGLSSDTSKVVDIIGWSASEIMTAIQYDEYHSNNIVIFKTNNGGESWQNVNFIGENISNYITHLELSKTNPDIIFGLGGLPVAKSNDRGKTWKTVYRNWQTNAFGKFIEINPNNDQIIWAGGANNIFRPQVVKTTDGGITWESLSVPGPEATASDICFHPSVINSILVGFYSDVTTGNVIRKSNDGGKNWNTVLDGIGIRTFTHSARNPEIVYGSGLNDKGTLFFTASNDFGDTWQRVEWADSPAGIQVNDMVSVMENGHEVLYLGTNMGLYSYTFEE